MIHPFRHTYPSHDAKIWWREDAGSIAINIVYRTIAQYDVDSNVIIWLGDAGGFLPNGEIDYYFSRPPVYAPRNWIYV